MSIEHGIIKRTANTNLPEPSRAADKQLKHKIQKKIVNNKNFKPRTKQIEEKKQEKTKTLNKTTFEGETNDYSDT